MADHYASSLDYISDALEARDQLVDLYQLPPDERDGRQVAALNGELGDSFKLAELHALLDIGQQLRDLRSVMDLSR